MTTSTDEGPSGGVGGRRSPTAVGLAALVLLGAGALVGSLLAPQPTPSSLAPATMALTAPVTYESFDDARRLPFDAVPGPRSAITFGRSGTVTSVACVVGGSLASGDVPVSIDSAPVAALHTDYPLWRDIHPGDSGPDVAAVQSELALLGYAPGSSGVMDAASTAALQAFFTARGYAGPDGSLSRAAILWLPQRAVVTTQCPRALADTVEPGDEFATAGGGLVALRASQTVDGLAPGARSVSFDGSSAGLDETGVVSDPAFLAAVAASPQYAAAVAQAPEGSTPQVTLTSALTTPLRAAVVPPGALYAVSGSTGCLSSGGKAVPVAIVASRLGATYVTVDDGATPTSVDLAVPADRTGAAGRCS